MTREEIIQAISDDKTMPYIQPEQLAGIVDFVIKNYNSFLDTLPEQIVEGLEEEMEKFFETMPVLEHENIFEDTFQNIARHFAEWGMNYMPLPEDTTIFQKGVAEGKRLMMEEAVDTEVVSGKDGDKWLVAYVGDYESMLKVCKTGDKVKVIVIPEEK